jgi:hypothetical protein
MGPRRLTLAPRRLILEPWRLIKEPGKVCRPVVADSHHFEEEDTDKTEKSHAKSKKSDPDQLDADA